MYDEALHASRATGASISSHFKRDKLSERENSVKSWVRLIILESCPFSIVTSTEYRRFNRFLTAVSVETVQITIIKMVELVEKRIQKAIEKTIGAVLFDGWSKRGVHYVAMVASYVEDVPVKKRDIICTENVQRLALIALSPMEQIAENEASGKSIEIVLGEKDDGADDATNDAGENSADEAVTLRCNSHPVHAREHVLLRLRLR